MTPETKEALRETAGIVWRGLKFSDALCLVEEWRKVGRPPPADRVDIARRLYDLEQEAARLRREMGSSLDEGGE